MTLYPWPPATYRRRLTAPGDPAAIARIAADLFPGVWRTTTDQPGFALIELPAGTSSHTFRRVMLDLADAIPTAAGGPRFVPERLGRFDQQVTTKFHRDGAPPASLLLLGYEPTEVRSRLWAADPFAAAADAGLGVHEFLSKCNPMTPAGEARLQPFATELLLPTVGPFIVVLNNSLPDLRAAPGPLGVLHKAAIPAPAPVKRRVINSVGLMVSGDPAGKPKTVAEIDHFLSRDDLD